MPDLLFLHQMDELAHAGCGQADCAQTHTEGRFFYALCHPDAGLDAIVDNDVQDPRYDYVLQVACWGCQGALMAIAFCDPVSVHENCQHGQAIDVSYKDGKVILVCRRCDALLMTAPVASYSQELA